MNQVATARKRQVERNYQESRDRVAVLKKSLDEDFFLRYIGRDRFTGQAMYDMNNEDPDNSLPTKYGKKK
jgi:hypothetical protein